MHTLRVFLKLCEMNLKILLINRANFFISLILMIAWVGAYVVLLEVIFMHTNTLAGWTKGEALFIMAFYYFIQNISDIFFKDNIEEFDETMIRGELDFHLIRPVSARLLAFFWRIRFDHAAGIVITGFLAIYAGTLMEKPLSISFTIAGIILAGFSLILYYAILTIIASSSFWIPRNQSFKVLIYNVSQLSRYPRQIYSGAVGSIFTYGIPIALLAAVPAEVALSKPSQIIAYLIVASLLFLLLSRLLWNRGLRRYTSAS